MKSKQIKFVIGSVLIVLAVGYTSISTTSKFFLTVDELTVAAAQYHGAGIKVKGKVVNGSINRNPDNTLDVSFRIEENKATLPVTYKGITPDMFEDGREVVVEGTLGRDGVFHANTLMTSCPSKYEAEKEAGKTHPGNVPYGGITQYPARKNYNLIPKLSLQGKAVLASPQVDSTVPEATG
jgi:cytochrome c-type biogenesis protein CcmE